MGKKKAGEDPTSHGFWEIWTLIVPELGTPGHWQACGFTGLQTGSFPSAGKAFIVASHTSPTSSMCSTHNLKLHCFWYNSSDQMDWSNTLMFSSEWLCGNEILVNICQRKEVNCKVLQSKHCPSLGLSVFHIFSLKSTVHNRGHILAATQLVMFNGFFRDSDKYP